MGRIFTIGEALIDFIPIEPKGSLKDVEGFIKKPGGAPANVAVCVSKLGGKSHFIGMLGDDSFGHFLKDTLEGYGVSTEYTYMTDRAKTALAFVSLGEDGQRDFSFYRNPSADLFLDISNVEGIDLKRGDFISFCSVDLVDYPVKKATEYLLSKANSSGATVLFDPNVRKDLWDDLNECRDTIRYFIRYADVVKISDDEMEFVTGYSDIDMGVKFIKSLGCKNVIVTLGAEGSVAYVGDLDRIYKEGHKVKAVDTTGAGDAFVGALLYRLSQLSESIEDINTEDIEDILDFSNKVASMTTTKKGAMEAMPCAGGYTHVQKV